MNKIKIKMKQHMFARGKSTNNNFQLLENKWNQRFVIEKIPNYDSYNDINFLSLGLIKAKIRKEENLIKGQKKRIKKSKTNSSSQLTLETRQNKNLNIPLLITKTENEKMDLFSIKYNNSNENDNLHTISELNITKTDYNKRDVFRKKYDNIYCNIKTNKTEQNSRIAMINNKYQEEVIELKELWKTLGITQEYQINFWKMLSKYTEKEKIDKYLSYEKKDLTQLKLELEKLQNEIIKRETDLKRIKQINMIYLENEELYNLYKNLDDKKKLEEKEEEKLNKYKDNKDKLENEIENILKSLRLHTINTVCLFSKFINQYNYYFTSGKIDINQMEKGFEFHRNYLLKIKSDTNFLQCSSLTTLYDFSKFENDPFFLSLLKSNEDQDNFKYLTATEDTLNKINQCMYIIDQEEILYNMNQLKKENKKPCFVKINQNLIGTNLKKEIQTLNRKTIKKLLFNKTNPVGPGKNFPLFDISLTENFNNNKINKFSKI